MDTALKERRPRVGKATPAPVAVAEPAPFVVIEGRSLAKAMTLMRAVVEKRNTIPILGTVRLDIDRASLRVTGTDLDLVASADLDIIDGAGKWSVCVDCRMLASIAKVAGATPMRISTAPGNMVSVTLGDGDATYEIAAMASDGFPSIKGDRGSLIESFTNGHLASLLGKVAGYMSDEEFRYYLHGVAWQRSGLAHRLAATDGHRMAICRYDGGKFGRIEDSRIIPAKAVRVLRLMTGGVDVALHAVTDTKDGEATADPLKLDFVWPGFSLRAKMVDGTYPDIDRVVPKPVLQTFRLAFNLPELRAALGRVSLVGDRWQHGLRVFDKDGRVALAMRNPDFGSSEAVLSAPWPECATREFGFNAGYFKEILAACDGDVTIAGIDASAALLISDADETMTRVLMPMRV